MNTSVPSGIVTFEPLSILDALKASIVTLAEARVLLGLDSAPALAVASRLVVDERAATKTA